MAHDGSQERLAAVLLLFSRAHKVEGGWGLRLIGAQHPTPRNSLKIWPSVLPVHAFGWSLCALLTEIHLSRNSGVRVGVDFWTFPGPFSRFGPEVQNSEALHFEKSLTLNGSHLSCHLMLELEVCQASWGLSGCQLCSDKYGCQNLILGTFLRMRLPYTWRESQILVWSHSEPWTPSVQDSQISPVNIFCRTCSLGWMDCSGQPGTWSTQRGRPDSGTQHLKVKQDNNKTEHLSQLSLIRRRSHHFGRPAGHRCTLHRAQGLQKWDCHTDDPACGPKSWI